MSPELIIFFDGVCSLCNHFVDLVLKADRKHLFFFAPLQGTTAQKLLSSKNQEGLDSILLYDDRKVYEKSDACFNIFLTFGGCWNFLYIFKIIPRFMRDFIYDFIACYRYSWFGKKSICRIPSPEEKKYFLD